MKKIIWVLAVAVMLSACHHELSDEHHHEEDAHGHEGHHHEETHLLLTAYSDEFEIFAECSPLVAKEESEMLVHITRLNDFKPLADGSLKVVLAIGDRQVCGVVETTSTPGIFHVRLTPFAPGMAALTFSIADGATTDKLSCPVQIGKDEHEAEHIIEKSAVHSATAIAFTKEQAWKTDFATAFPELRSFGQVIPAVAQIQPAQGDEMVVTAPTSGTLSYVAQNLFEGKEISKGTTLFAIRSDQLVDGNLSVRLNEAKINYETALRNYERAQSLLSSKIVSEKEYLELKNAYENAKLQYDNLRKNVHGNGGSVVAPMGGYVQQLLVQNGAYVSVGQPIMILTQTRCLVLKVDVPLRYASVLPLLTDATIENPVTHQVYDMKELGGRILSYGKSLSANNFMLPVVMQINNAGGFTSGSFVKVWMRATSGDQTLVIPKTALLEEQGNYFVFVQLTPELFEKQKVEIGATDGRYVEVKSGITAQQRVVTRGAVMVKLSKASGALDPHAGHVH